MAVLETPVACCAPLGAPALDEEEALATAELFKALGDPARVRIVNLLATRQEPVCACEMYEPLGLSQPTVSHHLKKLTDAGLLARGALAVADGARQLAPIVLEPELDMAP